MLKISEEALQDLIHHDWPGNVRELRGLMRQMTWKAQGLTIEPHHLPPSLNKGQITTSISGDRKSTRLNSSHSAKSRMPSSA